MSKKGSLQIDPHNQKLLYIMSPSFSGSTLLTILLADHPHISTIGELKATAFGDIHTYQCSCGERIVSCAFWADVIQNVNELGFHFSLEDFGTNFTSRNLIHRKIIRPVVRGKSTEYLRDIALSIVPRCRAQVHQILKMNFIIMKVVCDLQGGYLFLDSSKDPLRVRYLSCSRKFDLKIIFLTRDGRGTANSDKKHRNIPIDTAAMAWRNKILEMQNVLSFLESSQVFRLKYEELCKNPGRVLRSIYEFTGIDYKEIDTQDNTRDKHILGNNMRLMKIDSIKVDEKWKRELTEAEIQVFNQIAGNVNRSIGYDN